MKQLMLFICSIIITIALCTSFFTQANTEINTSYQIAKVESIIAYSVSYKLNHDKSNVYYQLTNPNYISLTSPLNNEESIYWLHPNKANKKRNYIFEFTMVFNDKLHQIIEFFSHNKNKNSAAINNDAAIKVASQPSCKYS